MIRKTLRNFLTHGQVGYPQHIYNTFILILKSSIEHIILLKVAFNHRLNYIGREYLLKIVLMTCPKKRWITFKGTKILFQSVWKFSLSTYCSVNQFIRNYTSLVYIKSCIHPFMLVIIIVLNIYYNRCNG